MDEADPGAMTTETPRHASNVSIVVRMGLLIGIWIVAKPAIQRLGGEVKMRSKIRRGGGILAGPHNTSRNVRLDHLSAE
jgi:hypothetical protein